MKIEAIIRSTLTCAVCIALPCAACLGGTPGISGWQTRQQLKGSDAVVGQLRDAGKLIASAVLNRDVETIVGYDRPDLRVNDRSELKNPKGELYCFLFDRSCNANGRASVREIILDAGRLEIEVQLLETKEGPPYGLLLFFDAAKVAKERLRSASFLCELSRRQQLVSWLFRFDNGVWVSAHPPFDYETDTLCSAG